MGFFFDARIEVALIFVLIVLLFALIVAAINRIGVRHRLRECAKGNHETIATYGPHYNTFECECGKVNLIQHKAF